MAYDVARVRGLHPSLGDGWVHFDAPSGMLIPDSVATTWSLSFIQVEQQSALAADVLRLCAWLHPDAIPEELFLQGSAYLGPTLAVLETDPLAFHQALAGFARRMLDPDELRILRLDQRINEGGFGRTGEEFSVGRQLECMGRPQQLFPDYLK